ncbi:MAG: HEAT repeat domain-containing protein [Elusimicrobia bacterium]|nr:HEAT repeat domain-containing protein [Elusimicrobiota bacterium]
MSSKRLWKDESGRLLEIPILFAVFMVSLSLAVGQKTWPRRIGFFLAPSAALVALFFVFFGIGWIIDRFVWARRRRGLRSPDPAVRAATIAEIGAYGWTGSTHAPLIAPLLEDPDASVRWAAAFAIARLHNKAFHARVVPHIAQALAGRDPERRGQACEAVEAVGEGAGAAVPGLITALRDREWKHRWRAAAALFYVKKDAAPAAEALAEALAGDDADLAEWAAGALGAIGPAAAVAVPALRKAADSPHARVKDEAKKALHKIAG